MLAAIMSKALDRITLETEKLVGKAVNRVWPLYQKYNERFPGGRLQPKWAPAPLLRKKERTAPQLGWPRRTDSLCPRCVKEVRDAVLSGAEDLREFVEGNPGEIKADIVERDGQVVMLKTCPKHGEFEDVMSVDPAFMARIESLFPGRDFEAPKTKLRNHGSSTIKYGRGSVLTVDLTNRCNMMCDPCFMDANQVGFVHELEWADIKQILDDSLNIKPRRQLSVQFSGGEPTLSPYFLRGHQVRARCRLLLRAVRQQRHQVRARSRSFATPPSARASGFATCNSTASPTRPTATARSATCSTSSCARSRIWPPAGIDVVLVVTVVNGVNNEQVGPIVEFAIDNADKVTVVSFQPVSFTGRDEDIDDARRQRERYTLSHLVHDLHDQLGVTEPMRDWFPLSAMNPFSDVVDLLLGQSAEFGALKCGCHPNCGIGTALLVNKRTKQMVPVSRVPRIWTRCCSTCRASPTPGRPRRKPSPALRSRCCGTSSPTRRPPATASPSSLASS